jgi:nucleotide-binding universal stress UspA family protein
VLDGSIPDEAVVADAIALAQRSGARLVFTHVDDDVSPHSPAQSVRWSARTSAAQAGVAAGSITLFGFTSAAITAAAQIAGADAIVIGDGDRSRRLTPQPAGVVNMLIRTAQVPVVVVPVATAASMRHGRVA